MIFTDKSSLWALAQSFWNHTPPTSISWIKHSQEKHLNHVTQFPYQIQLQGHNCNPIGMKFQFFMKDSPHRTSWQLNRSWMAEGWENRETESLTTLMFWLWRLIFLHESGVFPAKTHNTKRDGWFQEEGSHSVRQWQLWGNSQDASSSWGMI